MSHAKILEEAMGLSSKEALSRLKNVLNTCLKDEALKQQHLYDCCDSSIRLRPFRWAVLLARSIIHRKNNCQHCLENYCACFVLLAVSVFTGSLFALAAGYSTIIEAISSIILFLFIVFNLSFTAKIERLKQTEILRKAKDILKLVGKFSINSEKLQFPNLYSPASESIFTSWTKRDGMMVSLPWILLVEGDVILLRPGREAPCLCRSLVNNEMFAVGQRYFPEDTKDVTGLVDAFEPLPCEVYEAPFIPYIKHCFENWRRPHSVLDNEVFFALHYWIEKYLIPCFIIVALLVSLLRLLVVPTTTGNYVWMLIFQPSLILLPIAGLPIPLFAYILRIYNQTTVLQAFRRDSFLPTDTATKSHESLELFTDSNKDMRTARERFWEFYTLFKRQFVGDPTHLTYSANLVNVLGNVTSVSAVDKKGILSWPNPDPERIFFFRKTPRMLGLPLEIIRRESMLADINPEVLDLTHDSHRAFAVHFDDPTWQRYLTSLKPIGLNILLNSCELDREYLKFLDHIHVVSNNVPRTIAVVNRRCCCHLARLLGFQASCSEHFNIESTVAAYKRQAVEAPLPGVTKHRTPLPNLFAAIASEKTGTHTHVMAQGTSDLMLDTCSHCWTGQIVTELTRSMRRKIADFYHRYSMTSYCLAYSYKTVTGNDTCFVTPGSYVAWPLKSKEDEQHHFPELLNISDSISLSSNSDKEDDHSDIERHERKVLSKHIFLGMVTLQYQAKPDVVRLIDNLDKACIRFVHFSKENELRSRVFAEKMGLEAGWNCHISLETDAAEVPKIGVKKLNLHETNKINLHHRPASAGVQSRFRKTSLPPTGYGRHRTRTGSVGPLASHHQPSPDTPSALDADTISEESEMDNMLFEETTALLARSVSGGSRSHRFSNSAQFFMENTAQLPKGIEQIRPHLETKDNVPLLVNLFADCDYKSCREMIKIMQEYGEVVLVIGSSLNYHNSSLFCQGNISIALEPLQPSICVQEPPIQWNLVQSVTELATACAALPCSLKLSAGQQINLPSLLRLARQRLMAFRMALLFLLVSNLFLSSIQLLALIMFLPCPISMGNLVLWSVFTLPLIASSLGCYSISEREEDPLHDAPSKNEKWMSKKEIRKFLLCFIVKGFPTVVCTVCLFGLMLRQLCFDILDSRCVWYLNLNRTLHAGKQDVSGWLTTYKPTLVFAQEIFSLVIVLYICGLSVGFVHYRHNLWKRSPLRNRYWFYAIIITLMLQFLIVVPGRSSQYFQIQNTWYIFLVAVLWVLPMISTIELYKWWEIKFYRREHRRRRLSFGTKLGLNSPWG